MSNRKVFSDLLKVTQSLEADLGLSAMTQADKQVLASLVLITEDGRRDALLDDIKTHSLVDTMPTPSLYRSLKTLIQKGMVQKVGSERSGVYRLA
jgi:predicted transcriptional regulator